jgi:N-methylhydantoinase A
LSDVKYAYVRGMLSPLDAVSEDEVELQFLAMTNQAQKKLQERGLISYNVTILRSIDLRYTGQGYELEVAAPTPFQKYEVSERFEGMHETVYGYRHEGESLEVTALRITIVIHIQKAQLPSTSKAGVRSQGAPKSRRKTLFSGNWCEASVYSRELLPHDFTVSGPSIIEEYDSTIVVPPGWNCERNNIDCLILRRGND